MLPQSISTYFISISTYIHIYIYIQYQAMQIGTIYGDSSLAVTMGITKDEFGPRSAFWSLFFNPFVHDSANPTRKLVEKSTKPFPNTWLTSIHLKCPTSAVTFWLYITCAVSLPARTSHVFKTSCITTTRPPLHNIIPLSSLMPVLVETVSVEMVLVTSSLLHSEVTSDTGCICVPWSKHLLVYWALVITGKNIKQKKTKWCWSPTKVLWTCKIYHNIL